MDTIGTLFSIVMLMIGAALLVCLLTGLPVMLLWNALMPTLFGLPTIGFWQAVGLSLLCSMLFKSTTTTSSK